MDEIIAAAERVLSEAWGNPVRLGVAERQSGKMNRSRVLRCPVVEAPAGAPATVIVKCVQGDGGQAYDPQEAQPGSPAARLFNEWAATQFLSSLPAEPRLAVAPSRRSHRPGMFGDASPDLTAET